jgi:hypothetical protein
MTRSSKIQQTKVVERYLAHLNNTSVHSARSAEWKQGRIEQIQHQLKTDDMTYVQRLKLTQIMRNHEASLVAVEEDPTEEFVAIAVTYSEEHHIDYETWRELGVPAKVLKEAGW